MVTFVNWIRLVSLVDVRIDELRACVLRLVHYSFGYSTLNPDVSGIDSEFLHPVKQSAAFESQTKGGAIWSANAPFGLVKYADDSLVLFEVTHNRGCIDRPVHFVRQGNRERVPRCQNHRAFDQILQLPYVAGPGPALQFLDRGW